MGGYTVGTSRYPGCVGIMFVSELVLSIKNIRAYCCENIWIPSVRGNTIELEGIICTRK